MPEITLKFYNEDEMNQFIISKAMQLKQEIDSEVKIDYETKLTLTERKIHPWSQYELNFLIDNIQMKSSRWIAKALHRTIPQINNKIHILRKKGMSIPLKKNKNGKIIITKT